MIRRVVVLAPWHHHHAPYALDRILSIRTDLEVLLVTTPKLATAKRSALDGARATRSLSGVLYLGVMGLMSLGVAAASAAEKLRNRPRKAWKYLSMRRVLEECPWVKHLPARGVNEPEVLERIREFNPDLILLVFFNQIVSKELRALSPRVWNLHPSLLPSFRGVSPVFWALEEGMGTAGATLHEVTDELDQGPFRGQVRIRVQDVDSYFSLYRKCAQEGADLILKALQDPDGPAVEPDPEVLSSHFSYPDAVAVRKFHRRGRRFFRLW